MGKGFYGGHVGAAGRRIAIKDPISRGAEGSYPLADPYDYPLYYELAFSWRKADREVDVFEECIRRFARIPVKRVLEVACGPAYHLPELARRGYEYVGLDLNPRMLAYAEAKAKGISAQASFLKGDQRNFTLAPPVDFAFVLLGSLYVLSTAELESHLAAVARALRPGGLYFLDWCLNFTWAGREVLDDYWEIARDGVSIQARYRTDGILDAAAQLERDIMTLDVDDRGRHLRLVGEEVRRTIFPQEFLLLLERSGAFEFVGWWNRWDLAKPIETSENISRPITIIRRV